MPNGLRTKLPPVNSMKSPRIRTWFGLVILRRMYGKSDYHSFGQQCRLKSRRLP